MSKDIENKKLMSEMYRVMAACLDMESEVDRSKANIARLEENIENQKKRVEEIKALLKQ